jgi:hypothetical protein
MSRHPSPIRGRIAFEVALPPPARRQVVSAVELQRAEVLDGIPVLRIDGDSPLQVLPGGIRATAVTRERGEVEPRLGEAVVYSEAWEEPEGCGLGGW